MFFLRALGGVTLFFEKIKQRPAATALLFGLSLTVVESFVFNQNYLDFLRDLSLGSLAGWQSVFQFFFAFAALVFFVRSMLVSSFGWQCAYFGVFAFALAVEYGFYGALGRFTLPGDVENTFYASDASDKLGAITLFFSWLILAPLAVFRALFRFSPANARGGAKLFFCNLLILFGGFSLAADFYRKPAPMNAFAANFNNLSLSALYFAETKLARTNRQTVRAIENGAPTNNVVFIVDESVRADRLSLNGYARRTTPTLEALEKENLLKNWGLSAAGATESVGSNRLLLVGLQDLPDRENKIASLPTIFQYARAAGYRTFYFDGQGYVDWIGTPEDRRDFGQIFAARDFPKVEPQDLDRAFAAKINEITSNSTGNFIWVNKRGVHFRYEKNYPRSETVWTPTDLEAEMAETSTSRPLENNYDNALLYNSESFFRALVQEKFPPATVFVYTADHGQTLLHDRATHAGDSKPEAVVPVFLIGKDARFDGVDTGYKASHRNLFATLLDFLNYPKEFRPPIYAPSLLEAKTADSIPRTFFVGNPSGAFGGKKVSFDESEK